MSVLDWKHGLEESTTESAGPPAISSEPQRIRRLHRIQTIRRQQGLSIRSVARRMQITSEQARKQEIETSDLPLSTLFAWQQALDVPVAHLLVDLDGPISEPILKRARMLKLMKTAASLAQIAADEQIKRLATMLMDQLIELMPELKDVSPWHTVGQRRSLQEYGRVVERQLPDNIFSDPDH